MKLASQPPPPYVHAHARTPAHTHTKPLYNTNFTHSSRGNPGTCLGRDARL